MTALVHTSHIASVFGFRYSAFGFRLSAFGLLLAAFGFRLSASGFRLLASSVQLPLSAFGFRLSSPGSPTPYVSPAHVSIVVTFFQASNKQIIANQRILRARQHGRGDRRVKPYPGPCERLQNCL